MTQHTSLYEAMCTRAICWSPGTWLIGIILVFATGYLRAEQPVTPPNWTVDPGAYQFNMSIIARVQYLGVPTNASGNIVGVFVGNELRGVATPVDVSGNMFYFVTVYSNVASGENLKFKVYYQPNDAVYTSTQSLPFTTNALVGDIPSPYWIMVDNTSDLPPQLTTIPNDTTLVGIPFETINLATYLVSDDGDPVTYSAVAGANLSASISGSILTVTPVSGTWTGTDTVRVIATEQTSNMKSAAVTPKFTVNAFYAAPVLNTIPSQSRNTGQQFTDYDLDNSLVFSGSCRAFDYYVTPFSGTTANPGWTAPPPGSGPMTVIARPLFDDIQLAGSGAELAAFRGSTLIGKAGPSGTAPNITYTLTLANLGTGNITFKFYDAARQYLYTLPTSLAFVSGGSAGTSGSPYLVQFCPLTPTINPAGVVSIAINDNDWLGTLPVNYMVWDCPYPNLNSRRDTATASYTRFYSPNPAFTSASAVNFQENTCLELYDAQSYDPNFSEGSGLTYSIAGGADQSKFSINATTGKLGWNSFTPDFELPGDADANNVYEVTIRVTNTNNLTADLNLLVTITNNSVENFAPTINGGATQTCLTTSTLLTATGGGTYLWSTAQTTASIAVTIAGTYTVTVTNAVLCTGVASITVNQSPTVSLAGSSSLVCIGDQISLLSSPSGGTAPYTFSWTGPDAFISSQEDPAPFAASASKAGSYQVVVTDSKGCTASGSRSVVFRSEAKAALSLTASSPVCAGAPVTLTVTPTGGTTPYVYSWSGPNSFSSTVQNPPAFSAVAASAGTYGVTVTTQGGCVSTVTGDVVVNTLPVVVASGLSSVCLGSNIELGSSTSGGKTPYSYLWSGPNSFVSTSAVPVPFAASTVATGTYTVTVTDANGCTSSSTRVVTVSTTGVAPAVSTTGNSPVCAGSSITLTSSAAGGTTPYTYNWSGPAGFSSVAQNPAPFSASASSAGTYTVTVTTASGCAATATRIIQVNTRPAVSAASGSPVCSGSTVLLTSTAQGGSGGYSFAWTGPSGYTSSSEDPAGFTASPSTAGTYTVSVTDGNGCTGAATTVLAVSTAPAVAVTTGPTCLNNSLALNATASGGTLPYTAYAWSGPNSFTSTSEDPAPFQLDATFVGTYTVTVTDNAGCTATGSKTVSGNSNPAIAAASSGTVCQGGQITLSSTPQGGTGAGTYSFLWTGPAGSGYFAAFEDPLSFTAGINSGGVYTVKVTDSNGCTGTGVTTVSVSQVPVVSASNNGPLCQNSTALITSAVTGGSGSYSGYLWSGPLGFASTSANPAGFMVNSVSQGGYYNLTVTDANGCTSTASTSLAVSSNTAPAVVTGSNSPVCTSGLLSLVSTPSGGLGIYSYSWAGPAGFTSSTQNPSLSSLTAANGGTYTVTLTDASGCTAVSSTEVSLTGASLSITKTDVACAGGNTGSATLVHTGGMPPYTYLWSNGGTSSTISGLTAGTYTVTVTPLGGGTCTQTISTQINQGSALQITLASSTAACGGANGTATVSATGGSLPYTYKWPASAGNQTTATASSLSSGSYTVTVTDNSTCAGTLAVTITSGVGTTINTISDKGPICPGAIASSTILSSSPPNASTVYTWTGGATAGLVNGTSSGSGALIPSFTSGFTEGSYIVTVTASLNSCASTTTFTIVLQDETPPVISNCPPGLTFNNTSGLCSGVISWSPPTATDNCGSPLVTQNGGPAPGATLAVGNTQTVSYTVSDNGGNNVICTFTVKVSDTELPTLACPALPSTLGTNSGDCSYTVSGTGFDATASDNCGLKTGAAGLSYTATGAYSGTGTKLATVALPLGTTTFTWTAADAYDNIGTCVRTVTVVDDDAPVITSCPPGQLMYTSSNGAGDCSGFLPNFLTTLVASDNCTSFANLTKIQNPAAGTVFSGIHGDSQVVGITVFDQAGNSTYCSTIVTIADDEKPVFVNCPTIINLNNDVDQCGANVFFTAPGATDNCFGQIVVTQISGTVPGTYIPVNMPHPISFKAEDIAGNIEYCQTTIVVNDMQSPVLVCPAGVQDFDASASCNYTGTVPLNASATDNCGIASLSNNLNNTNSVVGYVFPLGNTVVTWTATDIYNNTQTCSYTVQITDHTAPVISVCPPDRMVNTSSNGTGDCTGPVSNLLGELVVADNCTSDGNLLKVQSPVAGSAFGAAHNDIQVVRYFVTDEAGNTSSCFTQLTLNDDENPVLLNCPPNLTASTTDQYPCYATRAWTHPGASDNCGISLLNFRILNPNNAVYGPVDIDPLNASYSFEVGNSVVTYQVADQKGNTATCSFSVTVTTVKSLVGNKIWHDQNGSGVQDAGEPGISGVLVTLSGTRLCDAALISQTVTSDASGNYLFTDVEQGTYEISFGTPAGYTPTTPDEGTDEALDSDYGPMGRSDHFDILIADTILTLDAGYWLSTRIGSLVWDDTNGNGLQDAGEPGISGVSVILNGTEGDGDIVNLSTTTNATGEYTFGDQSSGSANLAPGTYNLTFVLPAGGYVPTRANDTDGTDSNDSDADEATGATAFEVLSSGENNPTYDAGFYLPPSIGNYVWTDVNANGLQDSDEPFIAGAQVILSGTDGQGAAVNQSKTTDIYGAFLFDNLLPGSYRLTFPTPSGLDRATYPNEGTDDSLDSDADPASGNTTVFEVLTSGEHNKTYDAAFFSFASIGDRVWEDYSANGVQDAGEPGLAGVSVALSGTTGNGTSVSRTAVTAADGSYLFNNLIPGTYKLTFTNPTGYLTTQAASPVGNSDTNSDADPVTGMTPSTVLLTGERDFTWDAGYYATDYGDLPSSYGTTNGAPNGPSHILNPNLLLGLCADAELNGGNDTPPGTPVYGNCPAGSDDENGIVFVTPPVQGADACIRVTAVNTTGSTAVLQGWMDFNGDGDVLDAGEELQLTNNGIIPAGGVSDALYCFPVPAQVAFLNGSANVRFRLSPAGGLGPLGPAIGGEVEDYRVDVGRVGNLVWNDANFNGVQDPGEKGIADVPVELVWAGPDGDLNTTTDNRTYNTATNLSGQYYFSGIVKGTYRLRVLTPAMMSPARTDRGADDVRDSDGTLVNSDQSQVTQVFTISDPLNMPLGENSTGDQGVVAGYADAQTDETHDFGFAWLDYGDLPQENTSGQSYNTTQSETGAIHATTPQLVLGTCTDAERDGQPDDDAGVYDDLTTDSGDGDDGINNKGIDAQDCAGTPYAFVSASSYLCENRLIVRQINDRGSYVYYVVNGDFSPQINAAGGIAQVIGSTVIISDNAITGAYSGNQTALVSCIAQNDGIAESLIIIGGTVAFNLSCFDKDIVCNDDENGIRFETPLIPDNDACIRVTARNTTSGSAVLQGWIDWNGNKQLEASEALVLSGNGTIPSGGITNGLFCFPVPASAVFNEGRVYARFRLSPAGNLSPDGPGIYSGDAMPAGEVEDYIVEVGLVGNLVWEDRNFDGLQGNPAIEPGMNGVDIQLTWAGPDNELATTADNRTYLQKTATVNGKAGMYYFRGLINGTYRLTSTTPTDFTPTRLNQGTNDQLDADDFVNGDVFTWPDVSNLILNESGVSDMPGQMAIFPDRHDDQTHDMGYVALDFGDNPDSYSTLLPNGAHATIVPGLYLGSGVDSERNGAPDTESGVVAPGGDDNTTSAYTVGTAAGGDDENALRFLTPLVPGHEACVEINTTATAPYTPAYLSAWMDYNGNDAFDTDEKITFTTINGVAANTAAPAVPTGTATRRYCFNVLSTATFTGGEAYVRLRLNTTPDIAPTGLAIYGEVEDHWQPLLMSGNYAWMDSDIEGDQDATEMALAGVPVQLRWAGEDQVFGNADDRLYETTTASDGRYRFFGLIPGPYRITPVKYTSTVSNPIANVEPLGKILTIANLPPANDNNDSDASPSMSLTVPDMINTFTVTGEDGLNDNNGQNNAFPDNRENLSLDMGFINDPVFASALSIRGVAKSSSGICGQFDVIMDLCIRNTGKVPVNTLQAVLDLGGPTAFGSMFLGLTPGGAPQLLSSTARQNPVLNSGYNGTSVTSLFNGTSGLLWPDEQVCVRLRFELNPTAAGAPASPKVQAVVTSRAVNFQNVPVISYFTGAQIALTDLSDDGTDPATTNPLSPGDTGGTNDATPLTNCWDISQPLAQNDIVRISVDSTCVTTVYAGSVLEGEADKCLEDTYPLGGYYKVKLKNQNTGVEIPNPLTAAYIGQTIVVEIEHIVSCNKTWGKIRLEDNLAPILTCPADITVACSESTDIQNTGNVLIHDCTPTSVQIDNVVTDFDPCHTPRRVTERTFVVTDAWNNQSSCSQTITMIPFSLAEVDLPADITVNCESAYLNPGATAPAVTGQPSINGAPIGQGGYCSASIGYTDVRLEICKGSYEIYRTWIISNTCVPTGSGNAVTHLQRILVEDAGGPQFACPGDITVSVDPTSCCATAALPEMILTEGCSDIVNLEAKVTGIDFNTSNLVTFTVQGQLSDFPGNNYWNADTLAVFPYTNCLPNNSIYTVQYTAEDECGNTSACNFKLTVADLVPPVAACDQFTQVGITGGGEAFIDAATLNDGSYDNCASTLSFKIRRMEANTCDDNSEFDDRVKVCCSDIGDTIVVVLRVYDMVLSSGTVAIDTFEGHYNDCMVQLLVEDKTKPTCSAPDNVTVTCEQFDPSLGNYGFATSVDNCCVDTIKVTNGYAQFDTLCNKGTVVRTFRAYDCAGNVTQCAQRIVVNYLQDYYVRFPDDKIITFCDGTGIYDEPTFYGEDCELLGVTFEDVIFTVVPDACFKIERNWRIINWCTFDPNGSCVAVPNPNPNAATNHPTNLPGPIVSPIQTAGDPWKSTVVKVNPNDAQATNYSVFFSANANCYTYKQIIKITDSQDPVAACDDATAAGKICDETDNDGSLWNEMYWWDLANSSHDLCEAPSGISLTATDACSGANISFEYQLLLDLDGDGTMETVVNSTQLGSQPGGLGWNNIQYNNLNGTPVSRQFDNRAVAANQKWGFAIQEVVTGNKKTAYVKFNTQQAQNTFVTPQLPYGNHKIKWFVTDGCGNETICEYPLEIRDCKAPTVVCFNGLSVNIMPSGMISLNDMDLLQFTEDNHTQKQFLRTGVRKCGAGSGFPTDASGNPVTSVTFDCSEMGTQCVEVWSEDLSGNAGYCEMYVIIQDNDGNCPSSDKVNVSGALKTEEANGVEDALVNIGGTSSLTVPFSFQDMTDSLGIYKVFHSVPVNASFTITADKDDSALNGVTTYDLVLISRHILGVTPLGSPYRMIAADANRSGSITTFDIVELRKLILGIYTELPNNTSWRFVDGNQVFTNPMNPFADTIREYISVQNALMNQADKHFTGVKIGDVNGTAIANTAMQADDRSKGTLLFDVDDRTVKAGEPFDVTFKASEPVQGYQMTLNLKGLKVTGIVKSEKVSESNFGVFEDALTISIDGSEEFTVTFTAGSTGKLSEMLGVSSRITRAEAYSAANNLLDVALRFGGSTISGVGFELYQNQPNPFVNRTVIGFHLPEAQSAILTIADESGRIIYTQKGDYSKGYNAVQLDRALLNTTGVLYYTLTAEHDAATRKMIQLK